MKIYRMMTGWPTYGKPDAWPHLAMDWVFDFVLMLPLALTQANTKRVIRLLGLLWYVVWIVPAGVVTAACMFALLPSAIIVDTWRGDN